MKWLYWLPQSYFLLAYNVQRVIAEVVYQRIWGSSNSVSCSAKHVKKYILIGFSIAQSCGNIF